MAAPLNHEAVKQARRARRFALALYTAKVTPTEAETLAPERWRAVAGSLDMTAPSATTRQMAIDELAMVTQLLSDDDDETPREAG